MGYLLKVLNDSSYSWVNNVSCEEKGETEESVKKSETSDFSDELLHAHKFASHYMHIGGFDPNKNHIFPSSDFSQEVYFPPEAI
jgi:hypothetical protein